MRRKLAVGALVGVAWLVTFAVLGGDLRPSLSLETGAPAVPVAGSGSGGPVPAPTSAVDTDTSRVTSQAQELAGADTQVGTVLAARPKPRRPGSTDPLP